ncbi:MAG: phosphotransferase family protein [Chloroflexi bacterium]|nr:phosphotransferase family protein [Chloroflexota bacterium]
MDALSDSAIVVEAVRQGLGEPETPVEGARLLAGGAMHDSWAADAAGPGGRHELVVRLSPPGRDDSAKTRVEFALLRTMHARGLLVPKPLYVGENVRGQTFMLMERVRGDSNPRQLLTAPAFKHARTVLVTQLAEQVAMIHRVSPQDAGSPLRVTGEDQDPVLAECDRLEVEYREVALNPHPVIIWAFRKVRRMAAGLAPRTGPLHVVHGDLRVGNLMYDEQGLTSILDWEGVHIGEAEDDLMWFCTRVWRFSRPDLPAGGLATREEWISAYERFSGRTIDRRRFALWEVLGNIRWALVTMRQSKQHIDGTVKSHELLAIGRRTPDTELEILRLLGAKGETHAGQA